jgi:ABC-type nitrate/sulfonate/bicarbonate transport system substrate-binding protein
MILRALLQGGIMLDGKLRIGPTCYHTLHIVPIMAAHEMNFLYDEGLKTADGSLGYEILRDPMVPFGLEKLGIAQGMKERSVDIALDVQSRTIFFQRARGADVYIIAGWRNQRPGVIIGPPHIKSLQDVKGKRVGISDWNSIRHWALQIQLRKAGLDLEKDVEWIRIGPSRERHMDALMNGKVECAPLGSSDAEEQQGAPVVLKRDNGAALNAQAVNAVLGKYLVIPLNSPTYYPPYNGAIERAQRELKERLAEKLVPLPFCDPVLLQAYASAATNELNHQPRRSLRGQNSCELFQAGKPALRLYHRRQRKEVLDWINNLALNIVDQMAASNQRQIQTAWRIAVETWLRKHGITTMSQNKSVTHFSSDFVS